MVRGGGLELEGARDPPFAGLGINAWLSHAQGDPAGRF